MPDPRESGARLWDALIATAQHGLNADLPPDIHGARPRLLITLDHEVLKAGLLDTGLLDTGLLDTGRRVGVTGDGAELPAGVVRRLACDADLVPIVLGAASEVLDVGRTHRLVTHSIWTALIARDHHCTFPACTRPPVMCHAHHLRHWADGGPTSLDNLALLCGYHHRTVHQGPWEIRLNPDDRKPEFTPPPKNDTISNPIRRRSRIE